MVEVDIKTLNEVNFEPVYALDPSLEELDPIKNLKFKFKLMDKFKRDQ